MVHKQLPLVRYIHCKLHFFLSIVVVVISTFAPSYVYTEAMINTTPVVVFLICYFILYRIYFCSWKYGLFIGIVVNDNQTDRLKETFYQLPYTGNIVEGRLNSETAKSKQKTQKQKKKQSWKPKWTEWEEARKTKETLWLCVWHSNIMNLKERELNKREANMKNFCLCYALLFY